MVAEAASKEPGLDSAELRRRAEKVEAVRAASEAVGGVSDPEARRLQDAWARGEITGEQLVESTRKLQHYSVPRLL